MQRGYLCIGLLLAILSGYQVSSFAQGPVIFHPSQVRELEQGDSPNSGRKVGFSLDKFTKSPSQAEQNPPPLAREVWSQFFTGKRDSLAPVSPASPSRYRFSLGSAAPTQTPANTTAIASHYQPLQQQYQSVPSDGVVFEPRIVYVPVYATGASAQDTSPNTDWEATLFNDNPAVAMRPLRSMPTTATPANQSHYGNDELAMGEAVWVPRDRVRLVSGTVAATQIPAVSPLPSNSNSNSNSPKVYRPK